jgi:hypothetical protein
MPDPESSSRARTAFLAGYEAQVAGLYFNGVELLNETDRGAGPPLATRVGEERERVVGLRDDAVRRLDETARLAAALGAEPVAPPGDAAAYSAWAEAVFESVRATMAGDSPEAVAHLLGYVMGEAVATLDVLATLLRLRAVEPDHMWMRFQAESLERERETGARRLGRLAAHPLVPEAAQVATALAAHAVAEAAPSGSYGGRAARADTAAAEVAHQASAVAAAL